MGDSGALSFACDTDGEDFFTGRTIYWKGSMHVYFFTNNKIIFYRIVSPVKSIRWWILSQRYKKNGRVL